MTKEQLIKIWGAFADQEHDPAFKLNPDKKKVEFLAEGVLALEKKHGLKYCPCKAISKNPEENYAIICPCNFTAQSSWKDRGECWCSLFVKK